jgi:hypothetical protein
METDISELLKNQKPRIVDTKEGFVYIIQGHSNQTLHRIANYFKIGKAKRLQDRLDGYNTGNVNNIEYLYQVHTENMDAVEKCVKLMCKKHQYRKRKEIYEIDLNIMKQVLDNCAAAAASTIRITNKKRLSKQEGGAYYVVFSKEAHDI